mgnify:CR=1 FL=1
MSNHKMQFPFHISKSWFPVCIFIFLLTVCVGLAIHVTSEEDAICSDSDHSEVPIVSNENVSEKSLIVTSQFNMNVLDHSLFIFTNASRNRIKMLYYEANGFWLFTRRLENGKFKFKKHEESGVLMITPQQLNWLIEGLEFENKISEDTVSNCILI